ncbi:plant UBX domain-containing protein 2-like [Malania oleifera]|uniref:plant UBX domain-containing protein 2-like n=1 Tax=Malania oleifera TaxID=397392 RepID=UPI0025AE7E6E|nr:plant UBX domain-containing protein 2-like [Malania oleifera]
MWAVLEVPTEGRILLIKHAISFVEPPKKEKLTPAAPVELDEPIEPKKVDRQFYVVGIFSAWILQECNACVLKQQQQQYVISIN